MDPSAIGVLWREAMLGFATVGGPLLGALVVSGLVVGVLQAATQVNDPAVGFLPRLGVAAGVTWLLGAWMTGRLASFLALCIERMASRGS